MKKLFFGNELETDEDGEMGKITYTALANIVGDAVLNNSIIQTGYWEIYSGLDIYNEDYIDIFQYYIITENGAEFLKDYTDEIVFYNDELDMYLWAITHYGTSWEYVTTEVYIDGK